MIIGGRWCTCVEGLLSKELCQQLIQQLDTGCELEKVEKGEMASYDRNMMINADFAKTLYDTIRPLLPEQPATTGCNDHFRFSKYWPGQEFKRHTDGINIDAKGHRAKYTVNIFLNDNFEGGSTEFFDEFGRSCFIAEPKAGRAMIFDNQIAHAGNKVLTGNKYLIRTDVMHWG